MEQALLPRHEFYESAERHDALHYAFVFLADFRLCYYAFDPVHSSVNVRHVVREDLYVALLVCFVYRDLGVSLALDFLNNLTARADDGTDELGVNDDLLNTWRVWLQVWAVNRHAFVHRIKDVEAALAGLGPCGLDYVPALAIYVKNTRDAAE